MAWRVNSGSARVDALPPAGHDDRSGVASSVVTLVKEVLGAVRRLAGASVTAVAEAVETPSRVLTQRVTANAVVNPRPVADPQALAAALARGPSAPALGSAAAAAFAARMARRFRRLGFLARRTPMWILAAAVPALHASVTRGAEEVALVASHLVHRARAAGIEPDPERVRRATVQVMSGAPVDPATDPRHFVLVGAWLQRAARGTLPFGGGGHRSHDPHGLARRAAAVPPASLGGDYITTSAR